MEWNFIHYDGIINIRHIKINYNLFVQLILNLFLCAYTKFI